MKLRLLLAVLTVGMLVVPVWAGPYYIDSSNFHSTGQPIAAPIGSADPYYTLHYLCAAPTATCVGGAYNGPGIITVPNAAWDPNSSVSRWIADDANSLSTVHPVDAAGYYRFETTFTLTGSEIDPALFFRYEVDNYLVKVYLNGVYTGITNSGEMPLTNTFSGWHSGLIDGSNGSFVAGTNTLDFIVQNLPSQPGQTIGNPVGLRVENPVPEPGSLFLLGSGLIGAAGFIRRKLGR